MIAVLLREEIHRKARSYATVLGVLVVTGIGAFVVGAIPACMGAQTVATVPQLAAIVVFIIAVPVIAITEVSDYWATMYGPRGYLTMSLPARGRDIFAAKVLTSIAATLTALLVSCAGIASIIGAIAWLNHTSVAEVLMPLRTLLQPLPTALIWGYVIYELGEILATLVIIESLMSIGACSKWNHMGFAAPILGMVATYLLHQLLALFAMCIVPYGLDISTMTFVARGSLSGIIDSMTTGNDPQIVGLGFVPLTWIIAAVLACWAVRSIERHTSLR